MANTLTNLIPTIYAAKDIVLRELTGFIPAVTFDASGEEAAKDQTIRWPVVAAESAADIAPAATGPDPAATTVGSDTMTIRKARSVTFYWVGEEQKGLGGLYGAILQDQFAQSMRTLVQAYGSSNTSDWTPSAAGSYTIMVYARNACSTASYEAYALVGFVVTQYGPVSSVTLGANKTSPQQLASVGTVRFTAGATGGSGSYEYQFRVKDPATGQWTVKQAYGSSNIYDWTPSVAGSYTIMVYARNAGSTASYEAYALVGFVITNYVPVSSVTLGANKTSPQPLATVGTVRFTAQGSVQTVFLYCPLVLFCEPRSLRLRTNATVDPEQPGPGGDGRSLRAHPLDEEIKELPRPFRGFRIVERGTIPFPAVAREGELRNDEHASADVRHRSVHLAMLRLRRSAGGSPLR